MYPADISVDALPRLSSYLATGQIQLFPDERYTALHTTWARHERETPKRGYLSLEAYFSTVFNRETSNAIHLT